MAQGARDGGAPMSRMDWQAIARLGLLSRSTTYIHVSVLHCPKKLHPCNDAMPALPPVASDIPVSRDTCKSCTSSMAVGQVFAPAIPALPPSMAVV